MKEIKEVNVKYEAYDGKVFATEKECVQYEAKKWFSEENRVHFFMEDWGGECDEYLVKFNNADEFYDFDRCTKGVHYSYEECYYKEPDSYPFYGVYFESDGWCDVCDVNLVMRMESEALAKMINFITKGETKEEGYDE